MGGLLVLGGGASVHTTRTVADDVRKLRVGLLKIETDIKNKQHMLFGSVEQGNFFLNWLITITL